LSWNGQYYVSHGGFSNPVFSLEGETALITGGGSGPGLGIMECFVQAGARVALVGRRSDVLQKAVIIGRSSWW
jgi:NAD(P)-dependent dehydrogenase (short-subunit alcohol dehydrogenase family)